MRIFSFIVIGFVIFQINCVAQTEPNVYPKNLRFSVEAEVGCFPCLDTLSFLGYKTVADLRPILPSWRPVVSHDTVVIIEGQVLPIEGQPGPGWLPHVSWEDLPLFHYTHDLGFNVWPDKGYRNIMSRYVSVNLDESGNELRDTVIRPFVHCEWESGLGGGNKGNPASEKNRKGDSFGFASKGHERYDVIWNWPTTDDRVHLEGQWIWDRGHPPARTEIHPIRFMGIQRNLPEYISVDEKQMAATRIDVFANGDGSPFYNNFDTAAYVHHVTMSKKNYVFTVRNTLQQPTGSQLKYQIRTRKGHSFGANATVEIFAGSDSARITVPWKTLNEPDTAVFAQTIYLYWDAEQGTSEKLTYYEVDLQKFKLRRLSETWFLDRAELRIYFNIGSDYIFFNEFASNNKDILCAGLGRTFKRWWKVNQQFELLVPDDRRFRVFSEGWEADGLDKVMGHIIDQYSPCTMSSKHAITDEMLDAWPVGFGGCEDDNMGDATGYHTTKTLTKESTFVIRGEGKQYKENCPFGTRTPINFHRLEYSIKEIEK